MLDNRTYYSKDPAYRELASQLAVSPSQYEKLTDEQINSRFDLPRRVMRWLEKESQRSQRAVSCLDNLETFIVVPLDDVDLMVCPAMSHLAWSLLDELHQPRLLFVLAADLDRLESQIMTRNDVNAELTLPRAVLYKIMPNVDRIRLDCWGFADRLTFGSTASAEQSKKQEIQLLINEHLFDLYYTFSLTLLPANPRGLENFFRQLDTVEKNASATEVFGGLSDLLRFLADARGEFVMSRRPEGRHMEKLARGFEWKRRTHRALEWRSLILDARSPGVPLSTLEPRKADKLLRDPIRPSSGRTNAVSPDAKTDVPLWTELLLDLGMDQDKLHPREVIERFPPMQQRFSETVVKMEFAQKDVVNYFAHPGPAIDQELLWQKWEGNGEQIQVELGPDVLLSSLSGDLDSWPAGLLHELRVGASDVLSRVPDDRISKIKRRDGREIRLLRRMPVMPKLLPGNTRALLVLVDRLHAAPWASLASLRGIRSPGNIVRLVAGLMHAAYVEAIRFFLDGILDNQDTDPVKAFSKDIKAAKTLRGEIFGVGRRNGVLKQVPNAFIQAIRNAGTPDFIHWSDDDVPGAFKGFPRVHEQLRTLNRPPLKRAMKALKSNQLTPVLAPVSYLFRSIEEFEKLDAFRFLGED